MAFRPDGKVVATGTADGTVQLWDADTGQPIGPPLWHHGEVFAVAFRPDGKALLTSGDRGAWLWDVATDPPIQAHASHTKDRSTPWRSAPTARPSRRPATTGRRGSGTPTPDGRSDHRCRHEDEVLAVAFRPDGTAVATGSADDTAQLWDAATGQPIGEPLMHGSPFRTVAFHPDGKVVATGTDGGGSSGRRNGTAEASMAPSWS